MKMQVLLWTPRTVANDSHPRCEVSTEGSRVIRRQWILGEDEVKPEAPASASQLGQEKGASRPGA